MSARAPTARTLVRVLAVLLLAALAAEAFARGGGGGNFGGGGGGGGGYGGGGGGGGGGGADAIVFLVWLCFEYPLVGIPLLILVLIALTFGVKEGDKRRRGRVIRKGKAARKRLDSWEAERLVKATDPDFDKATFFGRVVVAFRKVQSAWCAHDLAPVRPFVSDGIHERFALQIQEQKDLGYRDHMEGLDVQAVEFAEVVDEGRLQIVTVRVRAVAADYRVDLQTGKHVSGSRAPETFVEYWSFVRRRGAKSKGGANGLIEGYCGNCGAPVAISQWSKCEHCNAFLRSGEHDWVLAEITQESEWEPSPPDAIRGVPQMRQRDPGFSVQHLEDRASVMFWRTAMSERLGDVAPMRKMATDQLSERWRVHILEGVQSDGRRHYFGERGVGSAEVLGVFRTDAGRDAAVVQIRWSGTLFSVDASGNRRRERKSSVITTLLHVERNAGVQSDQGNAVSSAHCASCGAADAGGETDACEYCGEVMNDGTREWALVDIVARHTDAGRTLLSRMRGPLHGSLRQTAAEPRVKTPVAGRELVAWMAHASLADGHLDEREERRLVKIAERSGMRREELDRIVTAARSGALDAPQPMDLGEARAWLDETAAVALADGHVTHGEQRVLISLGAQAGLSPADVRLALSKTRQRLYDEAKAALREEKRSAGRRSDDA